ncbi:hypothetical protein WP50_35050 [Lactiplantibacillus plantarum]|nr:hypothetical protein WP50_35050 [Lactiplantibacillus plantarum]
MQLTNILRDVGEDYQRGRIYLPSKLLAHYQLNPTDLHGPIPSANFIRLWEHEAQIAMNKTRNHLSNQP